MEPTTRIGLQSPLLETEYRNDLCPTQTRSNESLPLRAGILKMGEMRKKVEDISNEESSQSSGLERMMRTTRSDLMQLMKEKHILISKEGPQVLVSKPIFFDILSILEEVSSRQLADHSPFINFAHQIVVGTTHPTQSFLTTDQAKVILAKLIYLIDLSPKSALALIDESDTQFSIHAIENSFVEILQNAQEKLDMTLELQKKIGIQSPILSYETQRGILFSTMLITSTGHFNVDLIDTIISTFLLSVKTKTEEDLIEMFHKIKSNESIQKTICQAVAPRSSDFRSNYVIQACLGIPKDQITDVAAKRAVLSALIKESRQGPVGSCFATCWQIQKKDLLPVKAAQDYVDLVANDELSRRVDGEVKAFDYDLDIADNDLDTEFTVNPDGTVDNSTVSVWNVPGIQAGLRLMGIADLDQPSLIQKALIEWNAKNLLPSLTLTSSQLLSSIAQLAFSDQAPAKTRLAYFGFSSFTNNALDRITESTYAGMAEARESDYVKGKILRSIMEALKKPFEASHILERSIVKKIQNIFNKVIANRAKPRFYPSLRQQGVAQDGRSTEGGFVLINDDPALPGYKDELVDSPQAFKKFVLDAVRVTDETFNKTHHSSKERRCMQKTKDKICKFLSEGDSFLTLALQNYDRKNRSIKDPLSQLDKLDHTPWIDKTGNFNRRVMEVDFELSSSVQSEHIRPKVALDLLAFFLEFSRKREQSAHYLEDSEPQQLYPGDCDTHAFEWLAEHPTIIEAVKSDMPIHSWIELNVKKPIEHITEQVVDQDQYQLYIQEVAKLLPRKFQMLFKTDPKLAGYIPQSLNGLRGRMLSVLNHILTGKESDSTSVVSEDTRQLVDAKLFNHLPPFLGFKQICLHIADTNWYSDSSGERQHEIHFCVFYNPFESTYQFGTVNDDGSGLRILDQKEWMDQTYTFYKVAANEYAQLT